MTGCYDEGLLRTYMLDADALSPEERIALEEHLATCANCREQVESMRKLEARVDARMLALAPPKSPDPRASWASMQSRLKEERAARPAAGQIAATKRDVMVPALPGAVERRTKVQTYTPARPMWRRPLFSGLAAALLVFSMVAFPSLRAAADQLLQTFRAQSVVFVPVGTGRLQQLQGMNLDPTSVFATKPEITGGLVNPQEAASAGEAEKLLGYAPEQPSHLPGAVQSERIMVAGQSHVSFQVNVATLRDVLSLLNVTDVTLPDSLGTAVFTADIPPAAVIQYKGAEYNMTLIQGHSPTVNVPAGIQLSELGRAALEVLGMPPDQAAALSSKIDWTTTLVVPFPEGLSNVREVQVGDAQGLLVTSPESGASRSESAPIPGGHSVLYWQRGDHFYALEAQGTASQAPAILDAAMSVR